jgi:hypothetical protein
MKPGRCRLNTTATEGAKELLGPVSGEVGAEDRSAGQESQVVPRAHTAPLTPVIIGMTDRKVALLRILSPLYACFSRLARAPTSKPIERRSGGLPPYISAQERSFDRAAVRTGTPEARLRF